MTFSIRITEFPIVLLYHFLAHALSRAAAKLKNHAVSLKRPPSLRPPPAAHHHRSIAKFPPNSKPETLIIDIDGGLLRRPSFFPFFMLAAFEGGGPLRALLLLLAAPFLALAGDAAAMKSMIFITFCGMKITDAESVARAVLPKFYLECLNLHAFEALEAAKTKAVFTAVPRVMVEGFLREYLGVDAVVATELRTAGGYFTGLVGPGGLVAKHRAVREFFGDERPDVGVGAPTLHDHLFISQCKESYVITRDDAGKSSEMPRSRYPKPLVFHDGRLAFLPTPAATLAMFLWLPVGLLLAAFRLFIGTCLPYPLAVLLGTATGIDLRVSGHAPLRAAGAGGVLYVCSHRTLLDPVFLSTALRRPLTAVTYSLSKFSEAVAPIRTVRLTRDRRRDAAAMRRLLAEGDLVVCPEGTTCREPYLLRFSSLFAELADEIVPVAVDTAVGMFYGTTARGLKCLDPIFFLMNPRPVYRITILGKLPRGLTCAGGKTSHDVANYIQRQLGSELGFECTSLTRRDKYLMLAGNDGVVKEKNNNED